MRADLVAAALRQLAAAIEAPPVAPVTPERRWYTHSQLPPGASSWRAARERALRLGLPTARAGRETLIDAGSWDASLTPRGRVVAPADADATAALAAMGVVVPLRAGGGRR